jgi:hypothetical protein
MLAAFSALVSCHKKDNPQGTGTFYFHIHSNIGTNEVANSATLYADGTGRHFSLSTAQLYISNVRLTNAGGTTVTILNAFVLTALDSEQYLIGTAPAGTYTGVKFDVGLDAATNATTPSSHPAPSPLNNSDMWFGSTDHGYMFIKIQGTADTTPGQTGGNLVPFSYEIGSASNLRTVTMPVRTGSNAPYVLTSGGTQFIHMICDYGKMLSGIDFKTQDSTDAHLNPSIATAIANNVQNAFEYEE